MRVIREATLGSTRSADSRFYLPQLDGLRFLAFFLVLLGHLPLAPGTWVLTSLKWFGGAGVDLFFCLSAFLLTRLLVLERATTGWISFKRFFIRRVLRIWPLYYLMLLIGFFVLPFFVPGFGPMAGTPKYELLLQRFLLPHVAFYANFIDSALHYPPSVALSLLWTISAEEQFYLLLPFVIALLPVRPGKTGVWLMMGILAFAFTLRAGLVMLLLPLPLVHVNPFARPEAFLVGAALAFLVDHPSLRRLLSNKLMLVAGLFPLVAVMANPRIEAPFIHVFWHYGALAVGFGLILGHLSVGSGVVVRLLSIRPLVFAGKISYGLYVFQLIAIKALRLWGPINPGRPGSYGWPEWFLFSGAALTLTFLLATVSYYGFERWFLLLKGRYEVVPSRPVGADTAQAPDLK